MFDDTIISALLHSFVANKTLTLHSVQVASQQHHDVYTTAHYVKGR